MVAAMKWLRTAARVLLALALSAVIWNFILAGFFTIPLAYHHDPSLGWMPQPNSVQFSTEEGYAVCHYNEFGFRDESIGPKQPNEWRIAAIGDSYTEAHQVDNSQTFTFRLNQLLQESAPDNLRVRVLNGGRDNTTPAYYVHSAARYKQIFAPDWVVIVIHDKNWLKIFDAEREIYYRTEGNRITIEQRWLWDRMSKSRKLWAQWPGRGLPFFSALVNRMKQMRMAGADDGESPGNADNNDVPSDLTRRAIWWTVEQLKAKYPGLVIVHMPDGSAQLNGLLPPPPTEKWLIEGCRRHRVPLITMRERVVQDYARTGKPPLGFSNTAPWVGHPNAHGHDLIAHALRDFFVPRLVQSIPTRGSR